MIASMMKPRNQRVMVSTSGEVPGRGGAKSDSLTANGGVAGATGGQQSAAQARKRRSSINVYDQPSSLNSRLRQLETDMLRLDEDRTKLFDDTHSALAQYELKLSEIHAILKSRQDNVEKYVEDMRMLLQAKEDFEKQTKLLNEKHDRIHEKFMHRETIISREIKLLKNKFEVLEKNRQFRNMLQKSNMAGSGPGGGDNLNSDDLASSQFDGSMGDSFLRGSRSETGTMGPGGAESELQGGASTTINKLASVMGVKSGVGGGGGPGGKNVRIKMSNLGGLGSLLGPIFGLGRRRSPSKRRRASHIHRKSNKVSSMGADDNAAAVGAEGEEKPEQGIAAATEPQQQQQQQAVDPAAANSSALLGGDSLELLDQAAGAASEQIAQAASGAAKATKSSFLGRLFGGKSKAT